MDTEFGWTGESQEPGNALDLWTYVDAIWRRKLWVFAGMLLSVVAAVYSLSNEVPVFRSTARILIEPPASSVADLGQLLQGERAGSFRTRTQLQIFTSRAFIVRLIERNDLLDELAPGGAQVETDVVAPSAAEPSALGRLVMAMRGAWQSSTETIAGWLGSGDSDGLDESVLPLELRDRRMQRAITRIRQSASAIPVPGTHLVDIRWADTDPVLATQMANIVADSFVSYNLEQLSERSQQADTFLSDEIDRLAAEVRDDEAALDSLRRRLGVDEAGLGASAANAAMGNELASARSERLARESEYRRLQSMEPAESAAVQSDSTVRRARDDLERLQGEREDLARRLTDEHPQMKDLVERIAASTAALRTAESTAYRAALRDLQQQADTARSTEQRLASMIIGGNGLETDDYVELRAQELALPNKETLLEQFTDQKTALDLSSRVQGYQGESIQVIDRAVLPFNPASKAWLQTIALALLVGGLAGAMVALGLDALDNTLRTADDVRRRLRMATLGVISRSDAKSSRRNRGGYTESVVGEIQPERMAVDSPRSHVAEEYRELRTALLLSTGGGPPRSLMITSATPGEGKTTSTINLAFSLAHTGKKVLLVDGDLRRPRVGQVFDLESSEGFSNYLAGSTEIGALIRQTDFENLWVLPSGPIPPNPAELFGSSLPKQLLETAGEHFDIVLIDSPPSMIVVDPLILASLVDGIAVVVRADKTAHQLVAKTVERLRGVQGRILGVVLNGAEGETGIGYGRYRYGASGSRSYGYSASTDS
ncbi:MAG: polysaccharide biosynthesis tyrosine autokinase [Acidobacteria bacterium]|nr:polysaccharide biosynthesis tyrosine autokinase [Acidobacteriota bacterium]